MANRRDRKISRARWSQRKSALSRKKSKGSKHVPAIAHRNSIHGGRSFRATKFRFANHEYMPKFDITTEAYYGLIDKGLDEFPPEMGDPSQAHAHEPNTRTRTSECYFKCYGQEVKVAPGDCIKCPENAYCPDNLQCSTNWDMNVWNFIDTGYACCGCEAPYEGGSPYGKKLGWTYSLWSGDTYCDDGAYRQTYYACQEQTCSRYWGQNPWDIDDWENTFDGAQFYSGPWLWSESDHDGHSPQWMAHHMFYWAENQVDQEDDYWLLSQSPPDNRMYGWGKVLANTACPEWGWDCGDVGFNGQNNCGAYASHVNTGNWQNLTDLVENHNGDVNEHCNYLTSREATCAHKCNRQRYKNPNASGNWSGPQYAVLGFDPGGFAFTPEQNTDGSPRQCFCDIDCPACGCDFGLFSKANIGSFSENGYTFPALDDQYAKQMYDNCLASCGPSFAQTNCGPQNHEEFINPDTGTYFSFPYLPDSQGASVISGNSPGVTCTILPGFIGDCCDDWVEQCTIPKPELPCECFDVEEDLDFDLDTVNCVYSNSGNNCVFAGPTGLECSNDVMCENLCNDQCDRGQFIMKPSLWKTIVEEDINNYACVIENLNLNIFEEENQNYWIQTPACDAYRSYSNCHNNECRCECKCMTEDDWDLWTDFASNPEVGCNQNSACNTEAANCSKEQVESTGDVDWINHPAVQDSNYCRYPDAVTNSDTTNAASIGKDGDYIPLRAIKWWTGLKVWRSMCTAPQVLDFLNGTYDTCTNAYSTWENTYNGFLQGCSGCPDPYAENYTGAYIYQELNGTRYAMDCSGTGVGIDDSWASAGNYNGIGHERFNPENSVDTSCCIYAYGCGDTTAINYLSPDETNGWRRGGLRHPEETGIDGHMTTQAFCDYLHIMDPNIDEREDCSPNELNYWDLPVPQRAYAYCFAPRGCGNGYVSVEDGWSETDESYYCSYEAVNYCNVSTHCNYSYSCTNNSGDASCQAGPGFTCVNGQVTQCGTGGIEYCVFRAQYCMDSDGDGLDDGTYEPYTYGCDMDGSVYFGTGLIENAGFDGLQNSPDDSHGGNGGNEPTCNDCYTIDTTATSFPDIDVHLLLDGPNYGGYPLVPCDAYGGEDDPLQNCPTNMTHMDQGVGERNCQQVADAYHAGSYGPATFSLTDCCTRGGCCETDDTCPGEIFGSGDDAVALPCCYRSDDVGVCNMPNHGWFVVRANGIYQDTSSQEMYFDNIFDTYDCPNGTDVLADDIWDYSYFTFGSVKGIVRMEHSNDPGYYHCYNPNTQSFHSVLNCHCDLESGEDGYDYWINEGHACGSETEEDCMGVCGGTAEYNDCPGADCGTVIPAGDCDCDNNQCDCLDPMCGDDFSNGTNTNPSCGGPFTLNWFRQDLDGDGICNFSTLIEVCSDTNNSDTWPDGYKFAEAGAVGGWNPPNLPGNVCEDTNDVDDSLACTANFFDDCDMCDPCGDGTASCPEYNQFQDCNGDCFGDAMIDDCGVCSSGNSGHVFNSDMDECGLCNPNTGGTSTALAVDPFGIQYEIGWGSFGCSQSDWFNSLGMSNESNCNSPYCGCQCAGCTNMFSPGWHSWAIWDTIGTEGDWSLGADMSSVGNSDHTWRNICWDQEDGHHQCQLAQDIFNWIEYKYSSYCVNPGPETEFCALIQQDAICINPSGTVVDCSTADSVRLLDWYNNKQRDCWKWHGNMYWHYCDNTVTGNDACENYGEGGSECVSQFGSYCCGVQSGKEHCLTGERSDLWFYPERGDDDFIDDTPDIDWNYWYQLPGLGDSNADGGVNILDILMAVDYIMGDKHWSDTWGNWTPQTEEDLLSVIDINADGVVNILDIIEYVNIILGTMRAGGRILQDRMNDYQTAALTRNLLPLFGNSMNSRYVLLNPQGQRLGQNVHSQFRPTRRDNQRTRTSYTMNYFNFLFNSPYCFPMLNSTDFDPTIFELGDHFQAWGGSNTNVVNIDGMPAFGVAPASIGENDLTIQTTTQYHLLTVRHPEVKIQGSHSFRPVGGGFFGNVFTFVPESDSMCTSLNDDYIEQCQELSVYDCTDVELNNWAHRCFISYVAGPAYEYRGIYGYDMRSFDIDDHSIIPMDSLYYWLPDQHESCIPLDSFGAPPDPN